MHAPSPAKAAMRNMIACARKAGSTALAAALTAATMTTTKRTPTPTVLESTRWSLRALAAMCLSSHAEPPPELEGREGLLPDQGSALLDPAQTRLAAVWYIKRAGRLPPNRGDAEGGGACEVSCCIPVR